MDPKARRGPTLFRLGLARWLPARLGLARWLPARLGLATLLFAALVPAGLAPAHPGHGGLGIIGAGRVEAQGPGANRAPDCVRVHGEPRFMGFGQTHVVVVRNLCSRPVTCEVATNVDPSPRYSLQVAPGAVEEVATRQGSPASEFEPVYECQLR